MSNVSATQNVQPNFQLQKTAAANTDGFTIRNVEIVYRDGNPISHAASPRGKSIHGPGSRFRPPTGAFTAHSPGEF
jgi:hypothetical protein